MGSAIGASAVAAGIGVRVPTARVVLVALVVGTAAWIVLLPRRWFAGAARPVHRVILVFLAIRMVMPFFPELLTGEGDALSYHNRGVAVAHDLHVHGGSLSHLETPGTGTVDLLVGHLYYVGAPARLVAYQLWNLFAAIGMLLFWWSTKSLAGDRQRAYAIFILLTPSLLFWNSILGKDALLAFAIGCMVAGVRLLTEGTRTLRAIGYLALGASVAGTVRPHIGVLLLATAVIGVALWRTQREGRAPSRRLVPLVLAGALLVALVPAMQALINPTGGRAFVDAAYDRAETAAQIGGGSGFETTPTRSIGGVPNAVVTVLLRPFPWEVRSVPQMLTSAEGTVVAVLLGSAALRLVRRDTRLRGSPIVIMAIAYTLVFCTAFSSLGNFGLLVRQRAQVLPFVLLLVFAIATTEREPRASARAQATVRVPT